MRLWRAVVASAFILSSSLGAQSSGPGARFQSTAMSTVSVNGTTVLKPLVSGLVTVYTDANGANKATIFTNQSLTTALSNPLVADAYGNFGFWIAPQNFYYRMCPAATTCTSPIYPGSITLGAGIPGTVTATGVNGAFNVPGKLTSGVAATIFPDNTPGYAGYGDSIMVGIGTTTGGGVGAANTYAPGNVNSFYYKLAQQHGGTALARNCAEGGSQAIDIEAQMLGKRGGTTGCSTPITPSLVFTNPLVQVQSGTNTFYHCADTQNATACSLNEASADRFVMTWSSSTNKFYGVNMAKTGTTSADAFLPQYAIDLAPGASATATVTVPAGASGITPMWEALSSGGSTSATITIGPVGGTQTVVDTVQATGYSGTNVTSGFIGTSTAEWAQTYGGYAPGTYTVKFTNTGTGTFPVVAVTVPDPPAAHKAGDPRVVMNGVPPQSGDTNAALTLALDTAKKASVATAYSAGYPVVFEDFRAGNYTLDVNCFMAATDYTFNDANLASHTCKASTQSGAHPGDDGYQWIVTQTNVATGNTGTTSQGTYTSNGDGAASQTLRNPGFSVYDNNGRPHSAELTWLSDIGNIVSGTLGTYAYGIVIPRGDCFAPEFYTASTVQPYVDPTTQVGMRDPFVVCDNGTRLLNGNVQTTQLNNGAGFQDVRATGCTITAGAVGNSCEVQVALSIPEPDLFYGTTCAVTDPLGITSVGSIHNRTLTTFQVWMTALSTTATGGGVVVCHVTHN